MRRSVKIIADYTMIDQIRVDKPMIKITAKTSIVALLSLSIAGCLGPTYGTGKTAGETLVDDLGGVLSLAPKGKTEEIEYNPRPNIVKPADTSTLPAPQENIAKSATDWPETPAQKRARILADIEAGKRSDNFVTNKEEAAALGASEGPGRGSSAGGRRYLTDPPSEYRVPADTAAVGEIGETEAAKARAAKKAQGDGKTGWRKLVPWL